MYKIILTTMIVLLAVSLSGPVISQSPSNPPPAFCENNEGFDQWDFWVGEWNVYANTEARPFSGTNSITKHHSGCLIKEEWVNSGGTGGFSVNFYNPVKKEWRQVWVSNGYSIDYAGGLNDSGAMELTGHIYTYNTGLAQDFKGSWTPEENGDVVQHFEVYDAEKAEWTVWFEGRYVRKENTNDPDPDPPATDR